MLPGDLSAFFALLHEAILCSTGKRLAISTHSLGSAGIFHALRHEGSFRSAGKRLAVFADRFALAGFLREGRSDRERRNQCS